MPGKSGRDDGRTMCAPTKHLPQESQPAHSGVSEQRGSLSRPAPQKAGRPWHSAESVRHAIAGRNRPVSEPCSPVNRGFLGGKILRARPALWAAANRICPPKRVFGYFLHGQKVTPRPRRGVHGGDHPPKAYPSPRRVMMNLGSAGSSSTFSRRRRMATSTARTSPT